MWAAWYGHTECVSLLLESGARIEAKNKVGPSLFTMIFPIHSIMSLHVDCRIVLLSILSNFIVFRSNQARIRRRYLL